MLSKICQSQEGKFSMALLTGGIYSSELMRVESRMVAYGAGGEGAGHRGIETCCSIMSVT